MTRRAAALTTRQLNRALHARQLLLERSALPLARALEREAADVDGDNVRIVTAYRPNADEWESDLKARKGQK